MELIQIVESLIFASQDGITSSGIHSAIQSAVKAAKNDEERKAEFRAIRKFGKTKEADVDEAIQKLIANYKRGKRGFMLVERAEGWRIFTHPENAVFIRELFPGKKPSRLSPPALETLAIIAYRQPLTKASIEAVRGVSVDGVVQTLLDRNIIRIAGRADLPGRPLLYETTDLFLEHFGIKTVEELPNSAELRAVKLPEPEAPPEDEAAEGEGENQPELPGAGEGEETAATAEPEDGSGEGDGDKEES